MLVTGASGFLGGRLVQMLAARGDEVTILARGGSVLRHLEGIRHRVVRGDLTDVPSLRGAVQDATLIFHCAACSTDWAPRQTYVDANVSGTANLLAAARGCSRLTRFVHVSTTDVYGYPPEPCSEDSPFQDAGLPYNQTKGQGEQAVWAAAAEHGLPVTVVRPATIFGPRGKDFTQEVGTMLRQRMMLTIDGGRAAGGFTYVDNVAEMMLAAAISSRSLGQVYNICDGTGVSWAEYLRLFAATLKVPAPWINLSFRSAMRLASALELAQRTLRLAGRPLLTRHAVYLLGRSQEFPVAKAHEELEFRPAVSIEEGIERSVAWLRSAGRR